MGHIHLGVIPSTRKWRDVVGALVDGATAADVVAASARAAERDLLGASSDPVFVEAVRLLLVIPHAARSEDFADALRRADVPVRGTPDLLALISACTTRLDAVAQQTSTSGDFGQLAARALVRTLTECISSDLPGLFAATPEDTRLATRRLSWSAGIAVLSRGYFGTLVGSSLSYWLDRVLSAQVGDGKRFANVGDRRQFDIALANYTGETSRIIQEFAGGWYGKTLHDKGRFETKDAAIFGGVALKKITAELGRRRDDGD